jgi:Mg-chelatase subunit ChlD
VPSIDDLRVMTWKRPETAICLLVDRSGSMQGNRLVTACVTAAGCAWRAPDDYSVVAFAEDAWVMKGLHAHRPADRLVNDVLRLRGHGVTNLALALQTARAQLERSNAKRKVTILLSDCRQTTGSDPFPAARALDELAILAPDGDSDDADALAAATGAQVATIATPFDATAALARVLDR